MQDALIASGFDHQVVEFTQTTRSAAEAAAGTPNAVFPLSFDDLQRMTGGAIADIRQG